MGRAIHLSVLLALIEFCLGAPAQPQNSTVLTYHGDPARSGHFVVPGLTWERARSMHLDESFHARFSGHVYAQPLYWRPVGSPAGMLIVATEDNTVQALDARSGNEIWHRALGRPVPRSSLGCGNINPLGITGTPVIDPSSATIVLDAAVDESSGPRHRLFALSLENGMPVPGWPVDVTDALRADRQFFSARDQNQRGALALMNGTVYVPFGGHFRDCGNYHGWVVGVSVADPRKVTTWSTRARGGGIWAPGGISISDGSLFVATGNTFGARTWSDGEAVFRLPPDLRDSINKRDYFAPANWRALDQRDVDLGGTNPLPLDVPAGNGTRALMLALGKDGKAYLLDRNNLGGIGGALISEIVSPAPIRTAAASYSIGTETFVAFQGPGARCPQRARSGELTVLKITAGTPPVLATAWCGSLRGAGSPIVTTSDGRSDPIVWIVGAEGDGRLHGFRGDTAEPLFTGGSSKEAMAGLHHFQTLIAAENRLFVAADGRLYAFAFD
jgi:PQQ enzyme repeat